MAGILTGVVDISTSSGRLGSLDERSLIYGYKCQICLLCERFWTTCRDLSCVDDITRQTFSKLHIKWKPYCYRPKGLWLRHVASMGLLPDSKISGCACAGNAGNVSPPPRVSDPDMHHGKCVTHVPRCMQGSLLCWFLSSRPIIMFPAFPAQAQPANLRIW